MKPNRELTAIESALAQQVTALTHRVAELEAALQIIEGNMNSLINAYPDTYPRYLFEGTREIARAAIAKARQT